MLKRDPKCNSCGPDGIYRDAAGEKQICPCGPEYVRRQARVAAVFASSEYEGLFGAEDF